MSYILTTVIFSVFAYIASLRFKAIRLDRLSLGVAALLLLVCLADRHFACSAKLMFHKETDLDTLSKQMVLYETGKVDGYTQYSSHLSWDEGYFLGSIVSELKMKRNIPAYDKPEMFAHKIGTVNLEAGLLVGRTRSLHKSGWCVGDNLWRVYPENSKGAWVAGPTAYIQIEQIIHSLSHFKENGIFGILARPAMTVDDLGLFTLGIAVPPNIMHVFVPFEIYLLVPLTALFGVMWVVLLIRGRIAKRKAKIS